MPQVERPSRFRLDMERDMRRGPLTLCLKQVWEPPPVVCRLSESNRRSIHYEAVSSGPLSGDLASNERRSWATLPGW